MHANIIFVLVRPTFLGNLGAVARVLKNFSFAQLRLVEPPANYKDAEARRMSVGAFDVLKKACVFASLGQALSDVSLVVGTSSARQRTRQIKPLQSVLPAVFVESAKHKVAFVFGNERDGLRIDELARCHHVVTIPTNPDFPVLNMAQSAGIIAYELSAGTVHDSAKHSLKPNRDKFPVGEQDDELFKQVGELLDVIGFSRTYNRQLVLTELRQFYQRGEPTLREYDLLAGMLYRLKHRLQRQ